MTIYKIKEMTGVVFLTMAMTTFPRAETIKCPIPVKECIEQCGKPDCPPICIQYVQACRVHRQVDWDSFYKNWREHHAPNKDSVTQDSPKKEK